MDFGSTFEEYLDPGYKTHEYEAKDDVSFENMLTRRESLYEHLVWQLHMTECSDEVRVVGEAIIGNLDENTGFLDATIEEIAAMGPLGSRTRRTGRCASCRGWTRSAAQPAMCENRCWFSSTTTVGRPPCRANGDAIIWRAFRLISCPNLTKTLGVPLEQVIEEMEIIKKLDPKPGRKYSSEESQPVVPEVTIEKIGDDYMIRFEDDGMPHLRINRTYRQMMESKDSSKETRDYIKERFRSAVDLLKNIEHRRQTIYRVCQSIRGPPARLPRSRHRTPQADDVEGRCRRHRNAPEHRFARGKSQVCEHAAGSLRIAPVLYRRE